MDRLFHQLTVLVSAGCLGIISLSMLFPAHRHTNLSQANPNVADNIAIIQEQSQ